MNALEERVNNLLHTWTPLPVVSVEFKQDEVRLRGITREIVKVIQETVTEEMVQRGVRVISLYAIPGFSHTDYQGVVRAILQAALNPPPPKEDE